ncbi:methyltransferase [Gammaproteobacteria bacterium]|nr:methyltransferase [Gammaproteobacteria bacterium]
MPDQNSPNPGRIMQNMNAFHCSAALKGAIDLGLFTALGGDAMTAAALGRAIDAPERSVRILCDFLTIQGLLEKDGAAYRSSPDSALFLDENSPAYFGTVGRFMMGPNLADNFSNVAAVVRKGGTLLEGQGTVEPENPIWVDFARSMVPLMKPSADFIADLVTKDIGADVPLRVLDIAAGHGIFGIEIAVRHPGARIVALDWPAVLEVASENAEKAGVTDRLTMLPGSAFDMDYGDGFDLVLLTNFLHHFDVTTCTSLMRKVHGALNDGGRAITLEFVPNEDRVTPPDQASFAFIMLATTAVGDAYTFRQLENMAGEAGFAGSELHRMDGPPQSVIVSTK